MNGNDLNNNNSTNNNTYHATTNLNTAIEDLNANNINSATEVNIQGANYSDGSSNNTYQDMFVYNNGQIDNINNQNNINNTTEFGAGSVEQYNQVQGGLDNNTNNNQFINKPLSYDTVNNSNTFIGGSGVINPQGITNSNADIYMGGDAILANNNKKKVTYEPILETKKKPVSEQDSKLAKEGIIVIIFALILVAFVMAMPYIYDFFREVKLAFINR